MPSSDAAASADERAASEPSGEREEIDERAASEPHRAEPPGEGAGGRSELGGEEDVERGKGKRQTRHPTEETKTSPRGHDQHSRAAKAAADATEKSSGEINYRGPEGEKKTDLDKVEK